jgi:hypothetical protein
VRRSAVAWLVLGLPVAALVYWVASNTDWVDTKVPMPPRGEALVNPSYAAQRFAEALGARTVRDRALTIPAETAAIVLSAWHWSLNRSGRDALKRWVESGGRLVVDETLVDDDDDFERWSGITREYRKAARKEIEKIDRDDKCDTYQEEQVRERPPGSASRDYFLCEVSSFSSLTSSKNVAWALRNDSGLQAVRVQVGDGSVTVINATPFRYRSLFDGDHGRLFVTATQLRRGDDIHFLSQEAYPSLLALVWTHGAPVVALTLVLVALLLWRDGVRLGPIAQPLDTARRSLADQIRGTGQFVVNQGSGESLHAACVRALDEAADRRTHGYARLPAPERIAALARLTGFERQTLAKALQPHETRSSHELGRTIALLEAARRQILIEHPRRSHGA